MSKAKIDTSKYTYATTFAKNSGVPYKQVFKAFSEEKISGYVTQTAERRRVILEVQSAEAFAKIFNKTKTYSPYPKISATNFIGTMSVLIRQGRFRPQKNMTIHESWVSHAYDVFVDGVAFLNLKKSKSSGRLRFSLENLRIIINQLNINHSEPNIKMMNKTEVLDEIEQIFESVKHDKECARIRRTERSTALKQTLSIAQKLNSKLNNE